MCEAVMVFHIIPPDGMKNSAITASSQPMIEIGNYKESFGKKVISWIYNPVLFLRPRSGQANQGFHVVIAADHPVQGDDIRFFYLISNLHEIARYLLDTL